MVAEAVETLENRIGKNRPWIVIQPNGGDANVRRRAKLLQRYIDAYSIAASRFTTTRQRASVTATAFGTWTSSRPTSNLAARFARSACFCDEILIDEAEAAVGPPKSMIQRRYVFRDDLLAIYGTDPGAAHAIRTRLRHSRGWSMRARRSWT